MQRALAIITFVILVGTACAPKMVPPPDPRLAQAQKSFEQGLQLKDAGNYPRAEQFLQSALELRRTVLGEKHPDVADSLNMLGDVHRLRGEYPQAKEVLEHALALREEILPKDHPDIAASHHELAKLYLTWKHYEDAEKSITCALSIREKLLPRNHPDVLSSSQVLANIHLSRGRYKDAEKLLQRTLSLREEALPREPLKIAETLNSLGTLYVYSRQLPVAQQKYERALELLKASLPENHPELATSIHNLAMLHDYQGQNYEQAQKEYEKALKMREEVLGPQHPDVAASLCSIANLYISQSKYGEAEPLLRRAIQIQEGLSGGEHPDLATSLTILANLHIHQQLPAEAEPEYARAIQIKEKLLGQEHFEVGILRLNLANVYITQGSFAKARQELDSAIQIMKKALGEQHPFVGTALLGLGNVYYKQECYSQAEQAYKSSLEIREVALGKDHPEVAESLQNLAAAHAIQGKYEEAEEKLKRAQMILTVVHGEKHPRIADLYQSLGGIQHFQLNWKNAEELYDKALQIRKEFFVPSHPQITDLLSNLAQLRVAKGRFKESVSLFREALDLSEENLRSQIFSFSEARLESALQLRRNQEERLYSLARMQPGNEQVRRLALAAALLRKGRSVEEIANTSNIIYSKLSPTDREVFQKLRDSRTQLAKLEYAGRGELSPEKYEKKLADLQKEGDALEAELAKKSKRLRDSYALPQAETLVTNVAKSLPRGSALVEFVSYVHRPLVPEPGIPPSKVPTELRYLALLLFADGRTQAFDLGSGKQIDAATGRLRAALAIKTGDYMAPAQELYALAFHPLRRVLGKVRRLFLVPDGELGLVPFDVLHDGKELMVESFHISYLNSGNDLLPRAPVDGPPANSVVVIADPDFSSRKLALPALPHTRSEAQDIQRRFPQAKLLLGPLATKEAVLRLDSPAILHIATHGLYSQLHGVVNSRPLTETPSILQEQVKKGDMLLAAKSRGEVKTSGDPACPKHFPSNPLLRSALFLLGPQVTDQRTGDSVCEDSLLTALELASLNLWNTQLVVLSACQSGIGEVLPGRGVYGLRRSLMIAGTETLVTSLWNVADDKTQELMGNFYNNLFNGRGRAAALSEAMKELRQKHPHPHFWASFIVIGRDAPLRSLAPHKPPVQP